MRSWRWYSKLLLALFLLAFAYWVWPTPWRYSESEGYTMRENRFTGRVQLFDPAETPARWIDP